MLLAVNRVYFKSQIWHGNTYDSIRKQVKAHAIKGGHNFISKFERALVGLAKHSNCHETISGHIHTVEDKMPGAIHYLNSSDSVESMTAIVENDDEKIELIDYSAFLMCLEKTTQPKSRSLPLDQEPDYQKLELPQSMLKEEHLQKVP